MIKSIFILVPLLYFTSCNYDREYDGKYNAQIYCKCRAQFRKQGIEEWAYCHSEMVAQNKFYRYFAVDQSGSNILRKSMQDSTQKFMGEFTKECNRLKCW